MNHQTPGDHQMRDTEREELAKLAFIAGSHMAGDPHAEWEVFAGNPKYVSHEYDVADAVLAAGYRRPRQVTTLAELHALPTGSVIMTTSTGRVGKIKSTADGGKMICWAIIGDNIAGMNQLVAKNSLPATVLHEPEPQP